MNHKKYDSMKLIHSNSEGSAIYQNLIFRYRSLHIQIIIHIPIWVISYPDDSYPDIGNFIYRERFVSRNRSFHIQITIHIPIQKKKGISTVLCELRTLGFLTWRKKVTEHHLQQYTFSYHHTIPIVILHSSKGWTPVS